MPRSSSSALIPYDPEPERTLRFRRNLLKKIAETNTVAMSSKLYTFSMPNKEAIPTGFNMPETAPGNFEIKPAFLNLIERNQFGGGATEDPNNHIQIFVDYCSTIKQTGVSQSDIRMMLFPFSLRGNARQWITDLDRAAHKITDWNSMALVFYQKYYPPEKTNRLRSQITSFKQADDEALFEAWERYKRLIRECPHHGLNNWLIIMQFYNGLREENRAILDSAANGRFANNTDEDKAWGLIEEMAVHNQQYCRQKGSSSKIHDTDSISVLTSHIAALTQQLGKLQGPSLSVNAIGGQTDVTCGACGMLGHTSMECRTHTYEVAAFHSGNQAPNYYTENSRNHPNFSWRSNNVVNPTVQQFQQPQQSQQVTYQKPYAPPGFQKQNFQQPPPPAQSNLEAMMQQMLNLQATQSAQITELMAHRKIVDTQIAQMSASSSTRQQGSLPSKGQQPDETINAVTLRSGTSYKSPRNPQDEGVVEEEIEESENLGKIIRNRSVLPETDRFVHSTLNPENPSLGTDRFVPQPIGFPSKSSKMRKNNPETDLLHPRIEEEDDEPNSKAKAEVKLPYPSRQQNTKTATQFGKFIEMVKDLKVQTPFIDLLLQVPSYAKFMKDILSKKKNLSMDETVSFTQECNSLTQGQSPPKLRDPGSFSIPCTIGTLEINNALCDLGASVSVMPYSMYLKLNAGSLTHTSARVQLADRSYMHPRGILEDMPVKIGKFWIPVDFIVLDMAEDDRIPILLGRPFLNTAGAVIDVRGGRMTLTVGDETIAFNLQTPTKPMVEESVHYADFLDDAHWYKSLTRDPFDTPISVNSCVYNNESRPAEKPPSEKSTGRRSDPRKGTDPRWKSVCEMMDTDFDHCGDLPADFVGAVYGSAMRHLFDRPGKGADGEP